MNKFLLLVVTPLLWALILRPFQIAMAQPAIEWQYTYGGSCSETPYGRMIQTNDGGYAICGSSCSADGGIIGGHGEKDVWIIKLDKNGIVEWQKPLGSANEEKGTDIIQTSTGNYLVVGELGGTGGNASNCYNCNGFAFNNDFWLVMLDASGAILWEKNYGGTEDDRPRSVMETSDGNFLVTGYTSSNDMDVTGYHAHAPGYSDDLWVIKINSSGTLLWQSTLGGDHEEQGFDLAEADNGDYIVAGWTNTFNNGDITGNHAMWREDAWVVRLNPNTGGKIWAKCYGGNMNESGLSMVKSNDGNFVIAGYSGSHDGDVTGAFGSPGSDSDVWIFKIDNNGTLLWQRRIGGSANDGMEGAYHANIAKTCNDGFILFAPSDSPVSYDKTAASPQDNNHPIWMVRLNSVGTILWDRTLGSIGGAQSFHSGIFSEDGSYLATMLSVNGISGDKTVPNFSPGSGATWLVKLAYELTPGFENDMICSGNPALFTDTTHTNAVLPALSYEWTFGDPLNGSSNTEYVASPFHTFTSAGTYTVTLIVQQDCKFDTIAKTIVVNATPAVNVISSTICEGDSATLYLTGSTSQAWSTGITTSSITVHPTATTQYTVTATNGICSVTVATTVTVNQQPLPNAGPDKTICKGSSIVLSASGGSGYIWITNPSLSSSTIPNPVANPTATTTYTVAVSNNLCTAYDAVTVNVSAFPSADAGNDVIINAGDETILNAAGGGTYSWSPAENLSCTDCQSPIAKPDITTKYYVTVTDISGCTNMDSVLVTVDKLCQELFLPTAFSPNNDGQNDILYVQGNCVQKMTLVIYSRWGNKIFETSDMNKGWNGESKEKQMSTDLFVYYFEATLLDGEEIIRKGNILLIK